MDISRPLHLWPCSYITALILERYSDPMTIASMTGFARDEGTDGAVAWVWEVKSVNGKGLDLRCRMPAGYESLELEVRKRVGARISRGSLSIGLQVRRLGGDAAIAVNEAALDALLQVIARYETTPGIAPARLDGLLAVPGVVTAEDMLIDEEGRAARTAKILEGFERALDSLIAARREEGASLRDVLAGLVDRIESLSRDAAQSAAAQPAALKARFEARVQEFLSDSAGLSPERIAQEVALLATKADVREELDRLQSHVAAARQLLAAAEPVGRKLDFLAQEFNREANTLCSKSQDIELTRIGLELKNVIGQLREQVQNIE